MRRAMAVGILGLAMLAASATACAPQACPAIGWINTIEVDASAFGDAVFVQLCVDAGCSSAPGEEPTTSSDLGVPVHTGDGEFVVGMTTPDEATIRLYASDGTLLQESAHAIDWTEPTDVCGGPSTAAPITLTP